MARQLHIGLSMSATWLGGRHEPNADEFPGSQLFSKRVTDLAEAAHLDFVFRADFLGAGRGRPTPGPSSVDPTVQLAVAAAQSSRVGLVTTVSTTFTEPFQIARQVQSLHWASGGRAGWNIVTSLDGHRSFGHGRMPPADDRYARAQDVTELVDALWHGWPAPGVEVSENNRFDIEGPLGVPPHPSGTPPLFQAGASDEGRDFASRWADGIFASSPRLEVALELRQDLRRRAQRYGRSADDIRLMPGLHLVLGDSRADAEELHRLSVRAATNEQKLKQVSMVLGIDLEGLPLGEPVPEPLLEEAGQHTPRSRTHQALLLDYLRAHRPTLDTLLQRPEASPSAHWRVIGTPDDAVSEILAWHAAGAIDGFIALPGGSWRSVELFTREVVPGLVEAGVFRAEYEGSTLAEHLGITR